MPVASNLKRCKCCGRLPSFCGCSPDTYDMFMKRQTWNKNHETLKNKNRDMKMKGRRR